MDRFWVFLSLLILVVLIYWSINCITHPEKVRKFYFSKAGRYGKRLIYENRNKGWSLTYIRVSGIVILVTVIFMIGIIILGELEILKR